LIRLGLNYSSCIFTTQIKYESNSPCKFSSLISLYNTIDNTHTMFSAH